LNNLAIYQMLPTVIKILEI